MPSEQVVPLFALRGYRGPPVMVSSEPYFKSVRLSSFTEQHAVEMRLRCGDRWDSAKREVAEDVAQLEALAAASDAVRVIPAR